MAITMDAKNEHAANTNAINQNRLHVGPYHPNYWMRWELKSSALMIDGRILDTFKLNPKMAEKDERLDQPIYATRDPKPEEGRPGPQLLADMFDPKKLKK